MSSKGLCGVAQLKRFLGLGIDSIKIEGRMKSNLYIASTVRVYSQVLNDLHQGKQPDYSHSLRELKKIPNREYTEGSLLTPADDNSVYNKQEEICCNYEMAGTVLEIDPSHQKFSFQAKNKLQLGDTIEILPFHGEVIQININQLINMSEKSIEVAQPNNIIWSEWQKGIEAQNVARVLKQ